ncbi:MAG: hypothetical protein JWP19_2337 [Rhodoglobus sp.]|nr:hypothetical protein [Rhodoglobus sp.]
MADPMTPTALAVVEPAPKKRHRLRTIIVLIVVLALLVAGFFVADGFAKSYATGYVKDSIIRVLGIDPKTPVQVDLGGGSIILQAITGGVDEVKVHVASLSFGELSGAADIVATNVPLDSSRPLDKLGIVLTIPQDNVRKLAKYLSGLQLTQIDVGKGVIRIGTDLSVLFFTVPVSVDLQPSAKDGGINFDPKTVVLGGTEISVADLRANPQFAALAGDLLNSQQVCVAGFLPKALTIDDVRVSGTNLVISINGDGTALGGPALSTLGACPAGK